MRLYRKGNSGNFYADVRRDDGSRWQFATRERDEMKARAAALAKVAAAKVAPKNGSGGISAPTGGNPPPPPAPGGGGSGSPPPQNKLAAALAQLRGGAGGAGGATATAAAAAPPTPPPASMVKFLGKRTGSMAVGIADEIIEGFTGGDTPGDWDEDEEDAIDEAAAEVWAQYLTDTAMSPLTKFGIVFAFGIGNSYLHRKKKPKAPPPANAPPAPGKADGAL